jgi:hypothetical protein
MDSLISSHKNSLQQRSSTFNLFCFMLIYFALFNLLISFLYFLCYFSFDLPFYNRSEITTWAECTKRLHFVLASITIDSVSDVWTEFSFNFKLTEMAAKSVICKEQNVKHLFLPSFAFLIRDRSSQNVAESANIISQFCQVMV